MSRRDDILRLHREAIRASAIRHNARSISLVGSVARGEDVEGSDYDFLADFLPGTSYFDITRLKRELEELLGGAVDIAIHSSLRESHRGMLHDAIAL
ncbi:MAG: nucleotidyltransferase domain-containing protein [Acidimicrobiaceae bacterium]|nr:nucleotidyltransferase domain-containing protein [Acidimicrobiaceae bacterium]